MLENDSVWRYLCAVHYQVSNMSNVSIKSWKEYYKKQCVNVLQQEFFAQSVQVDKIKYEYSS